MILLRRDHTTLLPQFPDTVLAGLQDSRAPLPRVLALALAAGVRSVAIGSASAPEAIARGVGMVLRSHHDAALVVGTVSARMDATTAAAGNLARHLQRQLQPLLQRLGSQTLDVLMVQDWQAGVLPMETLVLAIDGLVRAGRIRYWGLCGVAAWQLAGAVHAARALHMPTPVLQQVVYTPTLRSAEVERLPAGTQLGVAALVDPFAGPVAGAVEALARRRGLSAAQVAMAWARAAAGVHAIALRAPDEAGLAALLASHDLRLAVEEQQHLDELACPRPAA